MSERIFLVWVFIRKTAKLNKIMRNKSSILGDNQKRGKVYRWL